MKKSLLFLGIVAIICFMSLTVYAVEFSDIEGNWAKSYITRWSDEKVINGYSDGTFRPNNNITRAEFIAMIMRIFEPTNKADLSKYVDVSSNAWYYDTLAKGVGMGAIKGDSETSIRPDAYITRQEAIVILNRILNLANSKDKAEFTDASEIASWAKNAVLAFTENGYVNGYEDGSIKPNAYITRAEITKILDKAISKIITNSGEIDLSGITGSIVIKAENVTLKNDDKLKVLFVLSESIKNSLSTTKNAVIINQKPSTSETTTENNNEGGAGGGGAQTTKVFTLTLKPKGNKYSVIKDGELVDGAKFSIVVDGVTIMKEKTFSKNDFFQFKLDFMTALDEAKTNKTIDSKKLIATIKEVKANSTTDLEKEILDSLSDSDKELIQELIGDGDKPLSEILDDLSSDDVLSLGTIFLKMDYNTFKSLIEKL